MENEYPLEYIKKLNTKQLLKLFPKILNLDEKDFDSLMYVTGLILALEKILTTILADVIKIGLTKELKNPNIIEFIINELTLMSKVKILQEAVRSDPSRNKRYQKLFNYLRAINDIRNSIFHGKLTNLQYKERSINDVSIQRQMLLDFDEASKKALGKVK